MLSDNFKAKIALKLEKERHGKRQAREIRDRRKEIEMEKRKAEPSKLVNGDVIKYCVRGIYLLYRGKEVVYVGMSTDNCMQRICDHYREATKQFETFSIEHHDVSDAQLRAKEKALIRKYSPCFNKTHNNRGEKKSVRIVGV